MPALSNTPILKDSPRFKDIHCAALYSGARFRGKQRSSSSTYDVYVEIQHVNLESSSLCGYLHIKGLTSDWPDLCTFFDAEIIGPHYAFLTRKWDASETTDRDHWSRFAAFKPFEKTFNTDAFTHTFENDDHIFMRWKEHFLVPNHRIESISGASFAGFYYICFQKSTGCICGLYFHENSERYQHLELEYVHEQCFPSFEFR